MARKVLRSLNVITRILNGFTRALTETRLR